MCDNNNYKLLSVDIAKKLHISTKTVNRYFKSCDHIIKCIDQKRCICYNKINFNTFLNNNTKFYRRTKYVRLHDDIIKNKHKMDNVEYCKYLVKQGINKNISLFAVFYKFLYISRIRTKFPYIEIQPIKDFYTKYKYSDIEKGNDYGHPETAQRYWFENGYIKAEINTGCNRPFIIHIKENDIHNSILIPACYNDNDIYKKTLPTCSEFINNTFMQNIIDYIKDNIRLPIFLRTYVETIEDIYRNL